MSIEPRKVAIWFPQLAAERLLRRQPEIKEKPYVLVVAQQGRKIISAVGPEAGAKGIRPGMTLADGHTLLPGLMALDDKPGETAKALAAMAEWCIRFTPTVAIDGADGLIFDAAGCTHLWGGPENYLHDIRSQFARLGYRLRLAMADTVGTAWALSRYGSQAAVVAPGSEREVLRHLPPAALRLGSETLERLAKLGLHTIGSFMDMPATALRRRFGIELLRQLALALGEEMEILEPVKPAVPYREQLPAAEPIATPAGIAIAIRSLLSDLCLRLQRESKGLRHCQLSCYRVDGHLTSSAITTGRPSRNTTHLFKLFEGRIPEIEPGLGIELFLLEASVVEDLENTQDALWTISGGSEAAVAELLDRIAGRVGPNAIQRFLPEAHHWPERSFRPAVSLAEKPQGAWRSDLPRPLHLLPEPERISVSVPMPDYPPLLFIYKGTTHRVQKADGPERIEQEWWLQEGLYRDYYCVENEQGARYWLFRLGDYQQGDPKWFLHGFFA